MKNILATTLLCCYLAYTINAKETIKQQPLRSHITSYKPSAEKLKQMMGYKELLFIENAGQLVDQHGNARKDIGYKLDVGDMTVFIGNGEMHYQWQRAVSSSQLAVGSSQLAVGSSQMTAGNSPTEFYRMDVVLLGADKNAKVIAEEPQAYYENYRLPQCLNGVTAHSYRKITYKNIYPNIDWVLYLSDESKVVSREQGNSGSEKLNSKGASNHKTSYGKFVSTNEKTSTSEQSQITNELKYDFIVHPGGDPGQIKLQYKGATKLALVNGALVAQTPYGSITENAPYTYYADSKQEVTSSFKLKGNILSYQLRQSQITDRKSQIIVDPAIAWCTYYGGSSDEWPFDAVCDDHGYMYVTGRTNSLNNVATSGAYQASIAGPLDAFIAKFSGDCRLLWATYYGGDRSDIAWAAGIDKYDNIYIAGTTNSTTGIASAGAHQTAYKASLGSPTDGFLVKFTGSGIFKWATYYGDTLNDNINGICTDTAGNVYIGGSTRSTLSIATPGAHQASYGGGNGDGFLAKFDSAGVRQWGSYYGGGSGDGCNTIACDEAGNVYIGGETSSTDNIATPGSFHPDKAALGDAFVAKFNSSGTRIWGTYFGGNGVDNLPKMVLDSAANIYLAGYTSSTDSIATPGSYQQTRVAFPALSSYIAKLDSSGQRLWGTYFNNAAIVDMDRDAYSNIWVSGETSMTTGFATPNAYKAAPTIPPYNDFPVFACFDSNASQQLYASYWHLYYAYIAADPHGNFYVFGRTEVNTGVTTPNAYQQAFGGQYDALLARFMPDTFVTIKSPAGSSYCTGESFRLPYKATPAFRFGNVFTAQLSDAQGRFTNPVTIGTLTKQTDDSILCTIPYSTPMGTGYRVRVVSSAPWYISDDNFADIDIHYTPHSAGISYSPVNPWPGLNVVFTATDTGGGTNLTYKWFVNGNLIPGTVADSFATTILQDGDVVCVEITSTDPCANPPKVNACSTVSVATGVREIERGDVSVSPNPFKEELVIHTPEGAFDLQLVDVYGRVVYEGNVTGAKAVINTANLPAGNYILLLTDKNGNRSSHKLVKE